MAWHGMGRDGTAWDGTAWHGTAWQTLLSKFNETSDKVLVFSWSTTMLDVLEVRLAARLIWILHLILPLESPD